MRKATVLIALLSLASTAAAEVSMTIYQDDGETEFTGGDIMVGTNLTVVVSSDSPGYWSGGVFVVGPDRGYGELIGLGWDPNSEDYAGSRSAEAGEEALVWSYQDSWFRGFDLYTDSNSVAGDWFTLKYEATKAGDPNIGLYLYGNSWDDPNSIVTFSEVPSRDFNQDDTVDLSDFAWLASYWEDNDCNEPNWCEGTDIDIDGEVNIDDLVSFVEYWLWPLTSTSGSEAATGGGGGGGPVAEPAPPVVPGYVVEFTVGAGVGYDYATINDAIAGLAGYSFSTTERGCIRVYPGKYVEQINDFYPGGHDLPWHCDLIGMGASPAAVVIEHKRRVSSDPNFTTIAAEIYADGLDCRGDNLVENLTVRNASYGANQNSVRLSGGGSLIDCVVVSWHNAVTAWGGEITIEGCVITGWFLPCVQVYSPFTIRNCTLYPKTRSWGGEHPAGIKATKSGLIENVTIIADIASSDFEPHYDMPWLVGVISQLRNANDTITVRNATMDLKLTTRYHANRPKETATWQVFGVVSGGRNSVATTEYPGTTIVEDCSITVEGMEDTSDPNGSGRGIMVAGVCLRGGGRMEVLGTTSISTSRTPGRFAADGYEHSLVNQNGTLLVDPNSVGYDENITYGIIGTR